MGTRSDRRLFDERYDNDTNAWITMTFVDGELAATTRLNLGRGEGSVLPSMAVYPDVVGPRLRSGHVILETTRLAANIEVSGSNPEVAYVAMRPGYMAAAHFNVDLAVASPRLEHMAFYRRILQFSTWCAPRAYPGTHGRIRMHGRGLPRGASARRSPLPVLQIRANRARGAFRTERQGDRSGLSSWQRGGAQSI